MSEIVIKALTPELLDDYLKFFDNHAFADNPHWASCYCYCFHFPHKKCDLEKTTAEENRKTAIKMFKTNNWEKSTAEENRNAVIKMIKNNKMNGYLAFDGDKAVGWINAGSRDNYTTIPYDKIDKSEKVGSLICFIIAKDYRRQGIARLLLDTACEGFVKEGFEIAEGYPVKDAEGDGGNFHGPLEIYSSASFEQFDEDGVITVMRKKLI